MTATYDNNVKELPHYIRVSSFNFTPIHDFIPKTQNTPSLYAGRKTLFSPANPGEGWNGPSRFISLDDGGGNNLYDNPPVSERVTENLIDFPVKYPSIISTQPNEPVFQPIRY